MDGVTVCVKRLYSKKVFCTSGKRPQYGVLVRRCKSLEVSGPIHVLRPVCHF